MSACARSLQRPPRSRARPSRTSFHSSSVSRITPSRSKTTASITPGSNRLRGRRAPVRLRRAPSTRPRRRRSCGRRRRAPSSSGTRAIRARFAMSGPREPSRTSTPCHRAIGGMPLRAKCCARSVCADESRLAAQLPARRIGSCEDDSFPIEIPTSGGCSESETSEPTVSPKRSPSSSVVTTATGAGKRRITSRSSSPVIGSMIWR